LFAQEENLTKKKKGEGASWHYEYVKCSRLERIKHSLDRLSTVLKVVHIFDTFLYIMVIFREQAATYRGHKDASFLSLKVSFLA